MALGSVLTTFAAIGIFFSITLEWTIAPRPGGFLIGFVVGVLAGLGATLAIYGLIERRVGS